MHSVMYDCYPVISTGLVTCLELWLCANAGLVPPGCSSCLFQGTSHWLLSDLSASSKLGEGDM